MDQQTYNTVTAIVFLLVAVAHLLRILFGWPVLVGGMGIPIWLSWLALLFTGALAYFGFWHRSRAGHRDA